MPAPPPPSSQRDIMAGWEGDPTQPVVSVVCHTFNHRSYIEQALHGFLMQRTNFPFEIILHDDASTDGTANIARLYAEHYPAIIKPILQSENKWSKGHKPTIFSFPAARGRYIALCEGDDYWVDNQKLQKQVDFLNANPEYGLVCTDMLRYDQSDKTYYQSGIQPLGGWVYDELLAWKEQIWTLTVCFEKSLIEDKPHLNEQYYFTGDRHTFLHISLKRKIHFIPDITSVYRVLPESASHFLSQRKSIVFSRKVANTMLYYANIKPVADPSVAQQISYKNNLQKFKYALAFSDINEMREIQVAPPHYDRKGFAIKILFQACQVKSIFLFFSFLFTRFLLDN